MRRSLALVCLLLASSARADDGKARTPKQLYEDGLRHYNIAEYSEAIAAWKQAYLAAKRPLLLFNIAQAYRLSGDCVQALTFYDSYARDETDIKNQDELDEAVAACKQKLATTTPPPVEKPAAPPPVAPTEPAPPRVAPLTPPPPTEAGSGTRKLGIGLGVAGVVAGGVGIAYALKSRSLSSELDNYTGTWGPAQQQKQSDGQRAATLGWVLGGAGVALAGAGAVMYFVVGRDHPRDYVIVPTPGGAAFAWSASF